MDVRALECFVAVARHRHFTRAADELYLTQSAVSQQVRRLEAELGAALFVRGADVSLTPAGEELLPRAEAILRDLSDARAAVTGAAVGTVRVSAEVVPAAAIAAFHAAHPAVRVSLDGGDVYVGGAAPPDWDVVHRWSEPLVVAGLEGVVELQSLRGRSIVLPGRSHPLRGVLDAAFASLGFGVVPVLEASDTRVNLTLVAAGLGVAVVPASWAEGAALAEPLFYETFVALRPGAPAPARALCEMIAQ
jgi:DNA-binding transcriptional LysR family regulator